jgi:hypothetical protein
MRVQYRRADLLLPMEHIYKDLIDNKHNLDILGNVNTRTTHRPPHAIAKRGVFTHNSLVLTVSLLCDVMCVVCSV